MGKNEEYPTSRQSKYRKNRCDDPKKKPAIARPPRKNVGGSIAEKTSDKQNNRW